MTTTTRPMPTTHADPCVHDELLRSFDPEGGTDGFLSRLRAGDAAAFEDLVREHAGRMLAVARRLLRCEQDADDAVQDAFVSAFKSIDSFEGGSSLLTWLHRITVNAALMKLRAKSRIHEFGAGDTIADLLPSFRQDGHYARPVTRWSDDAYALAERSETRHRVRACIDRLPEAYRTVLILRDIEELDTEETARLLHCTPGNVKTRLHRARQALRTLLEPHFAATN